MYLLEEEKELCPCDLADILGMSIPASIATSTKIERWKYCGNPKGRPNNLLLPYTGKPKDIASHFFKHINEQTQKLETA